MDEILLGKKIQSLVPRDVADTQRTRFRRKYLPR